IVFAVKDEAGGRDGHTVRPGERGGAQVHVAQAPSWSLDDDLSVHGFTARAGQSDGRGRAGSVRLPHSDQTRHHPSSERRLDTASREGDGRRRIRRIASDRNTARHTPCRCWSKGHIQSRGVSGSQTRSSGHSAGIEGRTRNADVRNRDVGIAGVGERNSESAAGTWVYVPKTQTRWTHAEQVGSGIHSEGGGAAGHTSGRIADHHRELRPVVRTACGWGGVAGRSRPRDSRTVLVPLIAERGSPCGGYAEGGRLAGRDGLAGWLRGDRGRHKCNGVDGEGGGATGDAARRIADHDGELRAVICCTCSRWRVGGRGSSADGLSVLLP